MIFYPKTKPEDNENKMKYDAFFCYRFNYIHAFTEIMLLINFMELKKTIEIVVEDTGFQRRMDEPTPKPTI